MDFYRNYCAIALVILASSFGVTTFADSDGELLPDILVTAEFRPQSLSDSATSTSVITPEAISTRAAEHLQEILASAPNINFAGGTSRARYFQIRGVGDRSQFQEPLNPSVGVVIDGVDFSGIGSAGTLFDIEQVEILRGPQGTLHGANALAGLINVRSMAPTPEPEFKLYAKAAEYDSYGIGFTAGNRLSENSSGRLAIYQSRSDGYMDNTFLDRDDTSDRDELTARARIRWDHANGGHMDLSLMHVNIENGYDDFSLDNNRRTRSDEPGSDEQESSALALRYFRPGEWADAEFALAFADSDSEYGYDEDWTYDGFHPYGYTSTDSYERKRKSWSAELRLLSTQQSQLFSGKGDWVLGAYLLKNREDLRREWTYLGAPFFASDYDTDTLAVFGQLDTALSDNWLFSVGIRFEQRDTDYEDSFGVADSADKSLWGGRLGLEYRSDAGNLWYASLSRGYRANGVNAAILGSSNADTDADTLNTIRRLGEFDAEYLTNWELGWKGRSESGRLQARTALFYMDRSDQQVRGSLVIPLPGGATSFVDYTDNAAEGSNYGIEAELDWLPSDKLRVFAQLGLLKTEFNDYINVFGEDLDGRDQAQAPEYQYSFGAEYNWDNGLFASVVLDGKDAFLFSDRHSEGAEAVELLGARFGYRAEDWSLSLWGRNLTDEDYYIRGFGSFGNDPRKDYITAPYYQLGEPRVIGISLELQLR